MNASGHKMLILEMVQYSQTELILQSDPLLKHDTLSQMRKERIYSLGKCFFVFFWHHRPHLCFININ